MSTGGDSDILARIGLDPSEFEQGGEAVIRAARRIEDSQQRLDRAIEDSGRRRAQLEMELARQVAEGRLDAANRTRLQIESVERQLTRAAEDSARRQQQVADDLARAQERAAARAAEAAEREAARIAEAQERAAARAAASAVAGPGGRRSLDAGDRAILGFGAVQAAQDAYYGPQYAINNLVTLAQMRGGVGNLTRDYATLGREGVASIGRLAAAHPVGTAAIAAAGVALLGLNKGLKDAELGWGDLADVVANTTPWLAAQEAITGVWDTLANTAAGEAVDTVWDGLKAVVHEAANLALGWDAATAAARAHNDEAAAAAGAVAQAELARARLARFQSPEQAEAAAGGKRFGEELAELGGAGGIEAIINRLAGARARHGAEDQVTRGDTTLTRREWARVDVTNQVAAAAAGNSVAAGELLAQLSAQGFDTSELAGAFGPQQARPDVSVGQDDLLDALREAAAARGLTRQAAAELGSGYSLKTRALPGGGRDVVGANRPEGVGADREIEVLDRLLSGVGLDVPGLLQARVQAAATPREAGAEPTLREQLDEMRAMRKAMDELVQELRTPGGPPPANPPGGLVN